MKNINLLHWRNVVLEYWKGELIKKMQAKDVGRAAFVATMNNYAFNFQMYNTHFTNASGYPDRNHLSTAKDIIKLMAKCTSCEKLMAFWGMPYYTFSYYKAETGKSESLTVRSTYNGTLESNAISDYHILGGKSGSIVTPPYPSYKNLTLVVKSKNDDAWLVGCVIQSSATNRFIPFKQLLDYLEAYRQNTNTPTPTISASAAAAGIIYPHNAISYTDVDYCMVQKNGDSQHMPASITKLMTALLVIDHCDYDEELTIESSDVTKGSGDFFKEGDRLLVKDAIPAMLLPSSNTLAEAFSRYVGDKILHSKDKSMASL